MIQVRAPNGTIIQFPDGTPHGQISSVMASYHDASQLAHSTGDDKAGAALSTWNGFTLGHAADMRAVGQAARTGLANLVGNGPGYGMSDAYKATKNVENGIIQGYQAQHPGRDLAGNVVGGILNPFSMAGGQYVGAAKGLLPAMLRAAAVGGAEGGVAGGPTGAAVGAVTGPLAPVLGSAGEKIGGVAAGIGRNVQRSMGLASPASVATRRLSGAIAKDVKAGVNPASALRSWPGASQPTLADVAGENTRALVRDAGTQGPARQTLARYRDQVAADLQDNALALTNRLTPNDSRAAPAIIQRAQAAAAAATTPPQTVTPGAGGAMLSDALNARATAGRTAVNRAYDAARAAAPDQAQFPTAELPSIASNVRSAISDFAPDDVPRVTRAVGGLDTLSTPNVRDLFELRSRLSNLRASADPVESLAAGRATQALDSHIDSLHDRNLITGDPEVVGLWRDAIGQRRTYGQQFEGNDLIQHLTSQDRHGVGRALAVAPEDASNVILGRNGIAPRQDLTRDLSRVQGYLGADHPAWQALQQEATERLLQQPGAQFGNALDQFQTRSPDLAGVILHQPTVNAANAARNAAQGATSDLDAVNLGRGVLGTAPDQYALTLPGVQLPLARLGARQAITDAIGQPTEGATGLLNRLSTATNAGRNLASTFGDDAADQYRQGLQAETDRMSNANWMAPQIGSKTFSSGQDAGHGLFGGIHGLVMGALKGVVNGAPLNDAERAAIVDPGVSQALSPEMLQALMAMRSRPGGMFGSQYGVAPLAVTSGELAGRAP